MLEATNLESSGWGSGVADGTSLVKKTDESGGSNSAEADAPFVPPPKVKTEHERYVEQKAEEVAQVNIFYFSLIEAAPFK